MDSGVVQSEVHENDEHYPHIVASEQVTHGAEEDHFDEEKKSVLNKVKAKAKKIKDTIKKHGHQVLDRGHVYNNEDQHTLDDDDLEEDEEMAEDPQVHETPIQESEDVKTAIPTSEQVEYLGKSGIDFGGTAVMGEEPRHDALLGGISSTTEIDQNIAKTFSVEEKAEIPKENLERSIGLEEAPHAPGSTTEAYTPPNYETKITDPSVIGKDEIEEITPVEESFAKMNVHEKPTPEPIVPLAEKHDQFVSHLSAATQIRYPSSESHDDQFKQETTSTNINRSLENPTETGITFNTITTTVEEQPHYEANIDEVVSPKDVIDSEAGSGEKVEIKDKVVTNEEQGDASNMPDSTAQHGKNIAHSLSEKLAPVYDKVAEVGGAVKSKVTRTSTGGVGTETKNEVSVKDYLSEKLKPGEEDKSLREVISEALHKRKEEPVKKEDENLNGGDDKMCEESSVKSPGKGVVGKLKGVVGSWFGKSEEKGGEDLSKSTNSGAEVEQVHQVVGGNKSSPSI
ncbi:hypothetical protein AAZX31_10G223200 [Glycine max]|nr:hypothetical protein JHK85_029683 [Glycine max]KAG5128193.1 hypothetical protein JHK82_029028 [Glycine max]KAH1139771.1 hypothetical protein GYH30_028913 [Glycine max]KAH1230714.1 Low-temperature-induced protein [Glycine max]